MKYLPKSRRGAFTLIELLVVIAIIAILVSLLLAGVFYAYTTMRRVGASNDEGQLKTSLEAFKTKYGIYPPDYFHLCSKRSDYNTTNPGGANYAIDVASVAVIDKMWPNIGQFGVTSPMQDWSGNGYTNGNLNVVVNEFLDGDQSLVFFLGGIPQAGKSGFNTTGFSVDPKWPGQLPPVPPATGSGRVNSFYNFPANRLWVNINPITRNTTLSSNKIPNFPSYKDYYNDSTYPVPYLYFSANNRKNGYTIVSQGPPAVYYSITLKDATGANVTVLPYVQSAGPPPIFWAPDSFQIICAGEDGKFGPGGVWGATSPSPPFGKDDLGSFNGNGLLAAPQ